MTTAPRPRFSVRAGLTDPTEHYGPFHDMPGHLLAPLQDWVREALEDVTEAGLRRICVLLRITPPTHPTSGPMYDQALMRATGHQLLDVVDELLSVGLVVEDARQHLTWLPDDAGSAYRINDAGNGLEERVTPAVRDAVRQTITEAAAQPTVGSAADHLAAAWQAAYGRGPDPVRAYSECIKAVESAAHAVVQPNNARATLGTMLGAIRNAPHEFDAAIPPKNGDPIAPAQAMMQALWDGQTSRHGGQTPTSPETLEAARAGVHLAAALVQWFVSGAVVRTP